MTGYIDEALRPLGLIIPKMKGYVKTFKVKDEDKNKNNKLISFRIDDKEFLEKYKAIWTKIDSIDSLLVYENKYYLQVYLNNCAGKIPKKQMTDCLDENFLKIRCYKCCITIESI